MTGRSVTQGVAQLLDDLVGVPAGHSEVGLLPSWSHHCVSRGNQPNDRSRRRHVEGRRARTSAGRQELGTGANERLLGLDGDVALLSPVCPIMIAGDEERRRTVARDGAQLMAEAHLRILPARGRHALRVGVVAEKDDDRARRLQVRPMLERGEERAVGMRGAGVADEVIR